MPSVEELKEQIKELEKKEAEREEAKKKKPKKKTTTEVIEKEVNNKAQEEVEVPEPPEEFEETGEPTMPTKLQFLLQASRLYELEVALIRRMALKDMTLSDVYREAIQLKVVVRHNKQFFKPEEVEVIYKEVREAITKKYTDFEVAK